ncbi:hypothetical protein AJ80_01105 [Polytolypa hystricis UAMH7299]|uniref:Queuine tRNA-ribosyltransferase accessory subunit 2 n=1 Tax=Polytolypa hystricis (strain UAMH7299) TaxID=1447883 RepID=A0A2B7Z1N4_POLH7|nr:hypothetical protein AJ80_01105 [Polytolypa hystricis UAMH7299]
MQAGSLAELPDEMFSFTLLNATPAVLAPRLGRLAIAGRKIIQTPAYVGIMSRGALPHITQDMMETNMSVGGLYAGLEDFIEKGPKNVPPIYKIPTGPHESALRKFICQNEDPVLILGPRRVPPVYTPTPNSANSITILTSVGFRQLEAEEYADAIEKLQPDMAIGLADIVPGSKPGVKRRDRMVDRTHAWMRDAMDKLYGPEKEATTPLRTLFLAPLLPLEGEVQNFYLQDLEDEMKDHIGGFAVYDASSVAVVPESMSSLVRFSLSEPATPQQVLREVALGVDMTAIPFISKASDSGIALDFVFPNPTETDVSGTPRPMGFDMWPEEHAADSSPLGKGCECYACQKYTRAYIRHLLSAKEMLAWTLLQVHNHHVMDNFFAAIRKSIEKGTFAQDIQKFESTYDSEMPAQSGQGPRIRGYQFRSEFGAPKKNPKQYGLLDDAAEKFGSERESAAPTPEVDAADLESRGFAEKTDQL